MASVKIRAANPKKVFRIKSVLLLAEIHFVLRSSRGRRAGPLRVDRASLALSITEAESASGNLKGFRKFLRFQWSGLMIERKRTTKAQSLPPKKLDRRWRFFPSMTAIASVRHGAGSARVIVANVMATVAKVMISYRGRRTIHRTSRRFNEPGLSGNRHTTLACLEQRRSNSARASDPPGL